MLGATYVVRYGLHSHRESQLATRAEEPAKTRTPLSRERVLRGAIELADRDGLDAVSMRKLGQELGVEAMSLYNHVSNKEDLLDGMVDTIVGEIELVEPGDDWKTTITEQMMNARAVMKRHPWAIQVFESQVDISPALLGYFDRFLGLFRASGFSLGLIHHGLHSLGSRMLGFTQELFDDSGGGEERTEEEKAMMMQQLAAAFPNIGAMMAEITHDEDSILGSGCDDDVEFRFSVELILDGLERLHEARS